ncbi:MAG: hypothetical protein R3E12_16565 [Candidatus Eisenbacteria bacterium]
MRSSGQFAHQDRGQIGLGRTGGTDRPARLRDAGAAIAIPLIVAGLWLAAALLTGPAAAQDSAPSPILRIFSVGGVLTADGTLWQYSPSRKWQTIDEAFRDQGKETHILPLPVPAKSIEEMVTFGFLRTTGGDVWLYDLEKDEWNHLEQPH